MSKREMTLRHTAIINKLKRGAAPFKEIIKYLEAESEITKYKLTIPERTFQRDLQDIISLYIVNKIATFCYITKLFILVDLYIDSKQRVIYTSLT